MKGVMKRLVNLGFSMELTPQERFHCRKKGYDAQFGVAVAMVGYPKIPGRSFYTEEILNMAVKEGDTLIKQI
jgi:ATP-dependent Clp protease ATP-binding subunit ClpC